jgi:hypothetical protein
VFAIGRAVKAYGADESFDTVLQNVLVTSHQHDDHVPSSLQWIGLRLRQGALTPELTPTEAWLLDPLVRYAHAAGLQESGNYFEALKARAMAKLALAARRQKAGAEFDAPAKPAGVAGPREIPCATETSGCANGNRD